MTVEAKPRITSLAPQFQVEDLDRSIAFYKKLGFTFGLAWDGFYAIGYIDGLELHLKMPPRGTVKSRDHLENDRIDAAAGVAGIEDYYELCVASGAKILKQLQPTEWGTKDFYLEDPDGNIISFGGTAADEGK